MRGAALVSRVLAVSTAFAMLLTLQADRAGAVEVAVERLPNILLILADDLGWRDVGWNGSEIQTPNLDRLASQGVQLDRYYAQPSCSPTRAALMTGKSPLRLGIVRPIAKLDPGGLPLAERLLPEYFRAAGYQTFMSGKWHLGHIEKRYLPHRRGFDHFYGHVTGGIGYWDHNHGGGHDWQRNGKTLREEGYSTDLITDEALTLMRERDSAKPMLLYVAYNAPHLPNEAPPASIAKYAGIESEYRRVHAAMVSELDRSIGRLLAGLEAEGIARETIVFFSSDNGGLNVASQPPGLVRMVNALVSILGEPLPTHALEFLRTNTLEGGSDNTPLRGGKLSVYEGGVRVPAAIWWPGQLEGGASQAFISAEDVLPTLLGAAGLAKSIPQDLDGTSRWPTLSGMASAEATAGFVTVGLDGSALYSGPWKLIAPIAFLPFSKSDPELYRVDRDPTEQHDISSEHPERVAEMSATLAGWPRGPEIHGSFLSVIRHPDRFGGEEDREPWAEFSK